MLAQTRPGAKGALLFSAAMPPSEFETPWPEGVPVQIHMMDADEWAEEDLPAARELVDDVENAELFLYPGDGHLFADSSLSDFDPEAAALLKERVLAFLDDVGWSYGSGGSPCPSMQSARKRAVPRSPVQSE